MSTDKKILVDNTMWMYLGKIVSQILGLVASVLVIRKLPVDDYGTYLFIFGLFFIYQLLITSPIKHLLLRFVPELRSKKQYLPLKYLLLTTFFGAIVLIVVFTLCLVLFREQIMPFFNLSQFYLFVNAFVVFVLAYAMANYFESLLSAYLLHKWIAFIKVLVVVVRSVSYFVLYNKLGVETLLFIEAGVSIVSVLLALFAIYFKVLPELIKFRAIQNSIVIVKQRMWRFWSLSLFSELGYGIIGRTSDQYIIAAMSNPYYVGLYGFSLKVFEIVYKILPLREFESVLKPVFFKKFSKKTASSVLNDYYLFIIKVILPVLIFPLLYFLIFGKGLIIHVFDIKYIEAYRLTVIALLSICLNACFYPLSMLVQLKERVEIILYTRIVAVFSITMGVFLMAKIGIVGVAIASLLGELFKNLLMLVLFRKYVKLKYDWSVLMRYFLILLLSVALFLPFYSYQQELMFLVLGSLILPLIYFLTLINYHSFTPEELRRLETILMSSNKTARLYARINPIILKLKF